MGAFVCVWERSFVWVCGFVGVQSVKGERPDKKRAKEAGMSRLRSVTGRRRAADGKAGVGVGTSGGGGPAGVRPAGVPDGGAEGGGVVEAGPVEAVDPGGEFEV